MTRPGHSQSVDYLVKRHTRSSGGASGITRREGADRFRHVSSARGSDPSNTAAILLLENTSPPPLIRFWQKKSPVINPAIPLERHVWKLEQNHLNRRRIRVDATQLNARDVARPFPNLLEPALFPGA